MFEDGRIEVAGRVDLSRQIPNLADNPRVVRIEQTDCQVAAGEKAFFYLLIASGYAASDEDWSEDLLLVNRSALR